MSNESPFILQPPISYHYHTTGTAATTTHGYELILNWALLSPTSIQPTPFVGEYWTDVHPIYPTTATTILLLLGLNVGEHEGTLVSEMTEPSDGNRNTIMGLAD